jgi:hypothetical protein
VLTNLNSPGDPLRQGDWCQVDGSGFGNSRTGTSTDGYVHFRFPGGAAGQADIHHHWSAAKIICRVPLNAHRAGGARDTLTLTVVPADTSFPSSLVPVDHTTTPNPAPESTPPASSSARGTLIYHTMAKTYSTGDLQDIINKTSAGSNAATWANQLLGAPQYSVKAYQMKYWSIGYSQQPVRVSGAVLIPDGVTTPMPLHVYQHATIITNNQAPSYVDKSSETKTIAAAVASHGAIVVMTDYVGDGICASPSVHDEYLCAQSEADNGVDALIAGKELIAAEKASTDGSLFLSGYSEGGQAVAALARLLQSGYPQYPVTAAAFMEGPYSMTAELNYLLTPPGVDLKLDGINLHVGSIICGKAVYAFNTIYNWAPGMSDLFISPYDRQVEKNFSTSSPSMIDLVLDFEQNTRAMLQPAFLNNVLAPTGKIPGDIASNDTYNWVPTMPVLFISSSVDTLIPWQNQQPYYQQMQQASPGKVSMQFTPFPLDHLQNFLPALVTAQVYFKSYQK